ncbi:hypothetical protein HC723_07575 [Vibrio sp. S11_S32]|uniref:baseplate J/gp47 family protein n=1 Tax=Vibrio sp. S11_S32 TaxID=2720225 RepID=UPI0016815C2C|nr:baseplate J/gp47 family protein [Vibrio sp. S11_S32]MBD1576293.1 hypothetical protein [Vibrio sp. S11_S32]
MAVTDDLNQDFIDVLDNAGVPITEEEVLKNFNDEVKAQGSYINNDSQFSPFWRLIEAMIVKPYFWLMSFLVTTVFPQSFVRTATGHYLDLWLWSVNLERKEAVKAQGIVVFERDDNSPEIVLPAGFTISTERINGVVYKLLLSQDTTLPEGSTLDTVNCIAEKVGSSYNLGSGYYQIPQTPVPGLVRVYNPDDWLTVPGADKESDPEARERYRSQYTSVSGWFIDDKYKLVMAEFGGVKTEQIYIEHGAPRGPGSANAYILLDSGVPSEPFLDAINKAVVEDGYRGLGDDMVAMALPEKLMNLSFEILPVANLKEADKAILMGDVEQYIRCVFRENQAYAQATLVWPQSLFSFSTLNQELRNTFIGLESVYTESRDFKTGLEIPRIESLTLTETPRT